MIYSIASNTILIRTISNTHTIPGHKGERRTPIKPSEIGDAIGSLSQNLPTNIRRSAFPTPTTVVPTAVLKNQIAPTRTQAYSQIRQLINKNSTAGTNLGTTDTSLDSSLSDKLWVSSASLSLAILSLKGILAIDDIVPAAAALGSGLLAYISADFGSGVYHWGVDNYGDASTPVFGAQIDAFQGHHKRPWTITKREFANNISPLAKPTLAVLAPFLLLPDNAALDSFVSVFMTCVMFSQQFHSWAHTPKSLLHPAVVALQDAGVLVSRKMHGAHHRPPYDVNYSIVSGICNRPLDRIGFYKYLEGLVWSVYGLAPRSWGETAPEWLEEGYFEDGSEVESELVS